MIPGNLAGLDQDENKISLIDCYRVALDFGLPAAQLALERLAKALPQPQQRDKLAKANYRIPDSD